MVPWASMSRPLVVTAGFVVVPSQAKKKKHEWMFVAAKGQSDMQQIWGTYCERHKMRKKKFTKDINSIVIPMITQTFEDRSLLGQWKIKFVSKFSFFNTYSWHDNKSYFTTDENISHRVPSFSKEVNSLFFNIYLMTNNKNSARVSPFVRIRK